MRNIKNITVIATSVLWSGGSTYILTLYAGSKMGATPVYLPLAFSLVSIIGCILITWYAYQKKIHKTAAFLSFSLLLFSFIFQIKTFSDILYVT
ncbi:hypothetical protein [Desulfogranum japonicum]|uniref:hypothetical protein n=1 Tax=Desulfogranum japonicum TaxID=231447 RepID=UPI00048C4836|nr:hypothetical protein [Desulfogranum japonicum]